MYRNFIQIYQKILTLSRPIGAASSSLHWGLVSTPLKNIQNSTKSDPNYKL